MINKEFLTLCSQLIAIDSTPAKGNKKAAEFLRELALSLGFAAKLQPVTIDGIEHANLIVRDPASGNEAVKGEILFQTHLDTVFPGPYELWTRCGGDPFNATVDGDFIYGLGTADVKLDFLCKLFALKSLLGKNLRRPFVLVGTYLEELDMDGVKNLLASGVVSPSMAVVGEPSEMNIVHGNNGYGIVTFEVVADLHEKSGEKQAVVAATAGAKIKKMEFSGRAVHSSVPHLGENAIYKMAEFIKTLSIDEEIVRLGAGSGPNTVPANAWVELRTVGVDANPSSYSRVLRTVLLKVVAEIQGLAAVTRRYQNQMFEPSHPTWNLAQLIQDDKGLKIVVSFRVVPGVESDTVTEWIDRLKSQARLVQAKMKFSGWTPPAMTPLQSELVVSAQAVCGEFKLPTKAIRKVSTTEMSFMGEKKIPSIVIGPGVSQGNSHTANEHNRITQLELAISYYQKLAERLCL